tara:strand:- start:229 stop:354 length:126 start_codon:yes stop_codon:yes gene_type:complete
VKSSRNDLRKISIPPIKTGIKRSGSSHESRSGLEKLYLIAI